jgi:hypothetical protein
MARLIFVDSEWVKNNTGIEQNVDDSKITPYIIKAHDIHLQPLLGQSFYDHLVVAASANTLTAVEQNLIENFIKPCVTEWSYYIVYPELYIKATNKGPVTQNSEWSTSIDTNAYRIRLNEIRALADLYSERLTKELKRGYSVGQYPLAKYIFDDNPSKQNSTAFGGLWLPEGGCIKYGTNNPPQIDL